MAKTRVTFTIEPEDADRLRAAAAREGVTTSSYIEHTVLERVARDEAIRATFAEADSATAAAYAAADAVIWPDAEALTPARRAELDNALDRALGRFPRSA